MTRLLVHGPAERVDHRYPHHVWVADQLVPLERRTDVSEGAGAVVDGDLDAATAYLARQQPLLLGPETVRDLLVRDPQLLETGFWTCWLPHGLSPEVVSARSLVDADTLGGTTSGDLVTLVGVGIAGGATWSIDAAVSLSRFEALVTGLDLLRCLGLEVAESTVPAATSACGAVINHRLVGGAVIRQRIEAADLYAVPAFLVELRGREGRILIRHETAPSALLVWRREPPGFAAPSLPKIKPNIQAPDSLPGGLETTRQLVSLLTGDRETVVDRATAMEVVMQATRLDQALSALEDDGAN